jgi:hypothetical protein
MKIVARFPFSFCIWLLIASVVCAQARRTTPMTDSKRIISNDTLREMTKADSDNAIPRSGGRSTNAAIVKELKDDFRSLQRINNAMMAYVWGTTDVDYGKVAGMLLDMNKRAGRLKKHLSLPEPKTNHEAEIHPKISGLKDLRDSLLMMDKAVSEFVNTPLLKNPDVISDDSAEQASLALNRLISVSRVLAKASSRMKDAGQK